jgi:hypothetical protein
MLQFGFAGCRQYDGPKVPKLLSGSDAECPQRLKGVANIAHCGKKETEKISQKKCPIFDFFFV